MVVKTIIAVLFCIAICTSAQSATPSQDKQKISNENDENGLKAATTKTCPDRKNLKLLEVLPGGGWDNLRNVDMGRVTMSNYSLCKITEDGQYILPDNTFVIPLKESKVSTFASLYDHWTNYSSTTATTVNVEAHGSFFFGSISGSFSTSHRHVKKSQVEDKAVTLRVQMRHTIYKVKIQPDSQLNPAFKSRLLEIAAHLQSNSVDMAGYLAAQLIRDFGTHIVTTIDAGAVLAQIENVKTTFRSNYKEDDSTIKAAASASFFGHFGISGSYSKKVSTKFLEQYRGNVTNSYTETWGGPPYRANFSVNNWEDQMINNLVAVDRAGDPLHFVITPAVLPELPEPTLWDLARTVEDAIKQYYDHNRYLGCMNPSSTNFNFQANEDDGTCTAKLTNFTFGGVYQSCNIIGTPGNDPCAGYLQKNPKTADYKCPTNYKAIKVHQGQTSSHCYRTCHGSWFWRRCSTNCGHGLFNTYWCVAEKNIPQHSGFLFGGIYSKALANPLTKSQRCPPKFFAQRFGATMHVCVSDDYELAARYAVKFGGFFSCSTGNPLSLTTHESPSLAAFANANAKNDGNMPMNIFLYKQGSQNWPKHCPHGYSQHLGAIESNCEIMFCVKSDAFSLQGLPPVRRPPFKDAPGISSNTTVPLVIVNNDRGKVYFQDSASLQWTVATRSNVGTIDARKGYTYETAQKESAQMSPGLAAGISIIATLVAGSVVALLVVKCRRKKTNSRETFLHSVDRYQPMPSGMAEGSQ
eukprot:gene16624-18314_t